MKYKLKYLNLKKLYGGAAVDLTKIQKEELDLLFSSKNHKDLLDNFENIISENREFKKSIFGDIIDRDPIMFYMIQIITLYLINMKNHIDTKF